MKRSEFEKLVEALPASDYTAWVGIKTSLGAWIEIARDRRGYVVYRVTHASHARVARAETPAAVAVLLSRQGIKFEEVTT